MSLKQFLKRKQLQAQSDIPYPELTIPGEPLIYSIKSLPGGRRNWDCQHLRDMNYRSILRSYFPSYAESHIPVMLFIRFYVSPPSDNKISAARIKKENLHAVNSHEMCDYLLSFLELMRGNLVNSYRQFVRIDAEKFYSNNPRTVFTFIRTGDYVELQNKHSNNTQTQSKRKTKQPQSDLVQSKLSGDGFTKAIRPRKDSEYTATINERAPSCYSTPQATSPKRNAKPKKEDSACNST